MSSSSYDLPTQISLQQKLLTSIAPSPDATNAAAVASAVGNINTSLSGLATALSTADSAIGPTLTYQQEVKSILDRENKRLIDRRNAIDKAYDGQKRMVMLTDSITSKNKAYNKILFILVIILLFIFVIKLLGSYGIIPDILLNILMVLTISIGLIYCVHLYIDIKKRTKIDFNQITLAEPSSKTPDQIQKDAENNAKSGNLGALAKGSNAASGCQGSACCPTGTTFNEKYNVCVPNEVPYITVGSGVSKDNYKYFATKDATTGLITYGWRDASATVANNGCGALDKYDITILGCKPTTSGFTTMSGSSADAKPFSATEYTDYGKV